MNQNPDLHIKKHKTHILIEFLTERASDWAETYLDDSAEFIGGFLRLDMKHYDHFEHSIFMYDLCCTEEDEDVTNVTHNHNHP